MCCMYVCTYVIQCDVLKNGSDYIYLRRSMAPLINVVDGC